MLGFEGISIEIKQVEPMQAVIGFKGFSFEYTKQQFFEPKNGFKSISIESEYGGFAKKIWHLL